MREGPAAFGEDGVERAERLDVAVDDGLVDQRPEVLGRLELGGVGRQVDEADAVGDGEARFGVPAGAVEHQEDDAVAPGAGLRAKAASIISKSGLSIPLERYHTVSPVAGATKAVT